MVHHHNRHVSTIVVATTIGAYVTLVQTGYMRCSIEATGVAGIQTAAVRRRVR